MNTSSPLTRREHPGRVPGRVQRLDSAARPTSSASPGSIVRSTSVEPLGLERVGEDLARRAAPCRRRSPPRGRGGGGSGAGASTSSAVALGRLEQRLGRAAGVDHDRLPALLVRRRGRRSRASPACMERSMIMRRTKPSIARRRGRTLPRPVPRPRAGRLPERRHQRPGARAGASRPRERSLREQLEQGRSGKRVLRAADRADCDDLRERAAPRCSAATRRPSVALTGSTTDGVNTVLPRARPRRRATRC